ncbi:lysophospholipid acyltransferase family protein [Gordonia sp. DT101]|uniref:lysophospholipid acyltransferase family protein n=1 Tax=Gordonia sp. DT101 TaxID=3416545 RepID=UPI003CF4EDF9
MWYFIAKYVLIGPLLWLLTRPRVVGREYVPADGPVIVAANHCAFIDSLLLCLVIRRRVTFVAKTEYFDRPGRRGALQRWFFTAVGQIPIDRRGGDRSGDALTTAAQVLADGGVWAIHPEGSRSNDGRVHRGRTGAMRMAEMTGAPVVPIALRGTAAVNPPGRRLLVPGRVAVVVGRPLSVDVESAGPRAATDRLMTELAALAALPYVDEYVSKAERDVGIRRRGPS